MNAQHLKEIRKISDDAGLPVSGFNGDADYSLVDPAQKKKYLYELERSLNAACELNALSVTIHSNALGEGGIVVNHYDMLPDAVKYHAMMDCLIECADLAGKYGKKLHLEPLNIYTDHVGNYLKDTKTAVDLCDLIGSEYLDVLYDAYHMQIDEGRICDTLTENIHRIGHVHIADVPGRHEPGTGEINYGFVCSWLTQLGYDGIIGCELFPKTDTATAVKAIMELKKY